MRDFRTTKTDPAKGNTIPDDHPQQCHWAKDTPHRCQMLGSMGHAGGWYCSLHWDARHSGSLPPPLDSYERFVHWCGQMAQGYPESPWSETPHVLWDRLHGLAIEETV